MELNPLNNKIYIHHGRADRSECFFVMVSSSPHHAGVAIALALSFHLSNIL